MVYSVCVVDVVTINHYSLLYTAVRRIDFYYQHLRADSRRGNIVRMTKQLHVHSGTVANSASKRIVHNGSEHVVVPVVMIVDGVLNGALVTHEEYGRNVQAWNDKPVTVPHPTDGMGGFISAGSPDVISSMCVGRVYNAKVDGDKLVAELWLDTAQAERVGRSDLLAALESGALSEVSTGYFSYREDAQGEHNGKPYLYIDRDIMPDHLAILPNEVGACSVQDGCGTRPNVFKRLAELFGLRSNHQEERTMCTKKDQVDKLVGNAKLSPEQIELLMGMDPEQLAMVQALAGTLGQAAPAVAEETEEEEAPNIEEMVSNAVAKALAANSRAGRIASIVSNSANVLSESTLKAMSDDDFAKYEASIRPVDYSGAGGFVSNTGDAANAASMPIPPKALTGARK